MKEKNFQIPIKGDRLQTEDAFDVLNPATGAVIASCSRPSMKQIDSLIKEAHEAQPAFDHLGLPSRRLLLNSCADWVDKHVGELAELLTLEQGKPLKDATREAKGIGYYFRMVSELPLDDELVVDTGKNRVRVIHKPYGVVGAITAWNFPLALAAWKIAPALLAGNSVVLKPSPDTPLSTLRLIEILQKELPAGVLAVVTGFENEGRYLVQHPLIRKISFTGSMAVGTEINRDAAPELKRVTLELGGNDAAIVRSDVEVAKVAPALFKAAFINNGQTCIALKRLYAHASIHDELVAALTALAQNAKSGDGLNPENAYGPMCNERQRHHVSALVEEARKNGGRIHCGGKVPEGPGYFYPLTIVSEVTEAHRIVSEEQFGPCLPIIRFQDDQDALDRANQGPYGLGGSIWTEDLALGEQMMQKLACGTAWLNQHAALNLAAPFGGAKNSGIGYEHGREGIQSFTQKQVLNINLQRD